MPSTHLTKAVVERLPFAQDGQILYWDTKLRGFGLLVGRRTKTYVAQRSGGRRRKIGRADHLAADAAREKALGVLAELAAGKEPESNTLTLRQAADLHRRRMRNKECSERSLSDLDQRLSYLADWMDRPLAEITRHDAATRHRKIGKNGKTPYIANSVFRAFRAIYNTARKKHDLPENPAIGVDWYKERRRREPVENLPEWWRKVVAMRDHPVRRAFNLFVISTGLRREDARTVRWEHIDFKRGTIHRPKPKGGEDRAFTVPLSRFTLGILRHIQRHNAQHWPRCPWVFPCRRRNGRIGPFSDADWQRTVKGKKTRMLPSPHRLRDSYASIAHDVGVSKLSRKILMNHTVESQGDVTDGYIRPSLEALRIHQDQISLALLKYVRRANIVATVRANAS